MFIDSHCHLDKLDYEKNHHDIADVITKAKANGVSHFLNVCVTLDEFPPMLEAIVPFPEIFASCGVHPLDLKGAVDSARLRELASHPRVVAIGETGLDYYYSKDTVALQHASFRTHIQVAKDLQKPLIIHTRDAREDTINILREEHAELCGGVLHCFTETLEMAEAAMDLGFYISISGIVTFKQAKELKDVVHALPLERLLIETDSPYLAPVPFRGKENQPAYVKHVAEYIAQLKGISVEEVAQQTSKNFFSLFNAAR